MPQELYSERKLRQQGLSIDGASKRLQFRLYFPRPPYHNVDYKAAKTKDGYNFVRLVLGHQGATTQKIQRTTGTKIEIHDKNGNLNGDHPAANDPTLHAFIIADTKLYAVRRRLEQAADMIAETLLPINAKFEAFKVVPGGVALLKPKLDRVRQPTPSPTNSGSAEPVIAAKQEVRSPAVSSAWRRSDSDAPNNNNNNNNNTNDSSGSQPLSSSSTHSSSSLSEEEINTRQEGVPPADLWSQHQATAPQAAAVAHSSTVVHSDTSASQGHVAKWLTSGDDQPPGLGTEKDMWHHQAAQQGMAHDQMIISPVGGWSMWSLTLPDVHTNWAATPPTPPQYQGGYSSLGGYSPDSMYSHSTYASPDMFYHDQAAYYAAEMVVPPYPGAKPHTKSYLQSPQYAVPPCVGVAPQQQHSDEDDADAEHSIAHLVELLKVPLQG